METKEIKIDIPEGYQIDKENSTFECIKFKSVTKNFRGSGSRVTRYSICNGSSGIIRDSGREPNHSIFATETQAKSFLAMARISQIIANDERFGTPFTDDEWCDTRIDKYTITRWKYGYIRDCKQNIYCFLAFHIKEQRDLFLEENEDLVKQYLMID